MGRGESLQEPLARLAAYHAEVLAGHPDTALDALGDLAEMGPLGGVLWRDGQWRADRFAATRKLLTRVLDVWTESSGGRRSAEQRRLVAAAAGRTWGVTGFPHDAKQVVAAMRLDVGERTVRRWGPDVVADPDVQHWVRAHTGSDGLLPAVADHALWPRPRRGLEWPERTPDAQELYDIAARHAGDSVRGALRREQLGFRNPDAREATAYPETVRDRLLALVRLLTVQRANAWLGAGQRGPGYNTWRQFSYDVMEPWTNVESLGVRPPVFPIIVDGRMTRGDKYPHSVAAAVQMFAFEVAGDGVALRAHQDAELRRRAHLVALVTGHHENRVSLNDPKVLLGLGDLGGLVGSDAPHLAVAPAASAEALRLTAARRDAVALKRLADEIRTAQPAAAKTPLIREYVKLRPQVVAAARFDLEHELIGLADQSVGYDCVTCEDRHLVNVLARQRLEMPAGRRLAFTAHAYRDAAVVHNKNNEFGAGHQTLADGEEHLLALIRSEQVQDVREGMEGGHQLWLAAGGVGVRELEHSLDPAHRARAVQSARYALRSSFLACTAFETLRTEFDLNQPRHTDGYISTVAWEFQSRMIRLRVLIAARIAIQMKLFTADDVNHRRGELRDKRFEFLPPPEPWADMTRIDALKREYRGMLRIPGQLERDPVEFVRVAITLSFLCAGRIPVVAEADGSIMTHVRFLDDAPAHMLADDGEMALDYGRACEWLRNRETDAGVISWYPRASPLARYLDRVSGGLFAQFRDIHDVLRPADPSHD